MAADQNVRTARLMGEISTRDALNMGPLAQLSR